MSKGDTCCYEIGPNYKNCTQRFFNPETRAIIGKIVMTPFKKATRRQRYDEIAKHLAVIDIKIGEYTPTENERKVFAKAEGS